MLTAIGFAGESEEKAKFAKYKEQVKKDPSLIRFYTFEEGNGIEVLNQVVIDPVQTSTTGGTLGSLTIQRYGQGGGDHSGRHEIPGSIPPGWTQGRWPWKAAVSTGRDLNTHSWEATKLFRTGITGVEFAKGGTLSGWVRIHEDPAAQEGCRILTLGDGWSSGFILTYSKAKYIPNGSLNFRLGASEKKATRVNITAKPFTQGVWHYFAVTFDNKTVKIYVDGKLKDEKPVTEKVIPTTYKDYPLVGPFFENNSPNRFGHFLMIGHNPPRKGNITSRFDIGELAIYNRALTADEIKNQESLGRPAMSTEQQLANYRELVKQQKIRDQIDLKIPEDSGRYFRINEALPVTVKVPVETGLKGDFKAVFEIETLYGKPVQKLERTVKLGEKFTEKLSFSKCGVYYLNISLSDADGKLVKKLDEKYCLGIVPPAPKELTVNNPVGFWAVNNDRFHFDSPIRRVYYSNKESFEERYEGYRKVVPNLRAFVLFSCKMTMKPEDIAFNNKLFPEAVKAIKGKNVFGLEVTSEPHTKDIKGYVNLLKTVSENFRPEMPDLKIVPPGAAPPGIPMIAAILKEGGIKYVDGVSYHPYTSNPIGDFLWSNLTARLKEVVAQYPEKKLILWNTEGGVNSLPRIKGRPMTRKDAHAARFPTGVSHGHQFFRYFISLRPEDEAAALQCHAILLDLLQGYKIYTICQTPNVDGQPSLRGISVTALAGQILNNQQGVTQLKLATLENMCLLIKNTDGSITAAIFSMNPATINFKVQPNAEYKTMDMLGNYGKIKANSEGLITVKSVKNPYYIFNVPTDMKEVVPLKVTAPAVLPENRVLKGEIIVSNPFSTPLKGTLSATAIRGASIKIAKNEVDVAPGKSKKIAIELKAEFLKRRSYLLNVDLNGQDDKVISSAQTIFQSQGVRQMVPEIKTPITLDGNESEWKNIKAVICDDPDSVVHGKPNYAEVWVPQWINKEDLSISLKTAWCKDNGIYFLLKVTDNKLMPAPDDKVGLAFKYDCLEFFFDSRKLSELGSEISPGADQVVVIPQVKETTAPCKLWYAQKKRNHINLECVGRKNKDGYLIEGKVTPNDQSNFKIRAGSQFMMDFLIDDTDSLDLKWMRKSAMAVHGKFSNFNNSNIWGRYQLEPDSK
jgi:hypothetical protein